MNPAQVPNLAKAINRWLSYQLLCGRGALLSEAYLGQPTAEFLIHHHPGPFDTEMNHPVLNNPGPGRPRQIDYVLLTPQTSILDTAIECKWIAEGPYDKQRILNDLLRLECIRVPGSNVKRYFVVAGLKEDFDNNFKGLSVNEGRRRADFTHQLLSFVKSSPRKSIAVRGCSARFQQFYRNFSRAFNAEVPVSFQTELLDLRTNDGISVGIWKVASVPHRGHFAPSEQWPEET
jgi:hypothetical protein